MIDEKKEKLKTKENEKVEEKQEDKEKATLRKCPPATFQSLI